MQRRQFMNTGTTAAFGFLGLQKYLHAKQDPRVIEPYGPLVSDPKKLLDLPKGFSYKIISKAGTHMSDGHKVPGMPDGMACFAGREGSLILVRNHELSPARQNLGPFKDAKPPKGTDRRLSYDPGYGKAVPHIGGTTNIVYDPAKGVVLKEFLSLTGTDRNCAGGVMPWGSWITCEEPADLTSRRGRKHGYCFEVRATDNGRLQEAIPLKNLGRFRHEAVALDPLSGILYLTEDISDGLLYRFIPEQPEDLSKGKLQALCITEKKSMDTRNYPQSADKVKEGQAFEVTWIDLDEVEAPKNDLRIRGNKAGAAMFARGEGIQYSDGSLYICCTDGGPERQGQIYKLTPAREADKNDKLELFLQPTSDDLLTNGDNLCAAPWGDLILCEDLITQHKENTPHIRGVTPDGKIYSIARNASNKSEFAGSCFSPDGKILFVNMQANGLTLAITGPWQTKEKA